MEIVVVESTAAPTGQPGAATVLEASDLQALAPQSLGEILATVPGVHLLEEDGAGMRLNLSIRGLPAARSAKVLVLEDGVPIAPGPYGHPELYYVPAVERLGGVEVVRGNGSIRFGPQTIGGVVNLLSARIPEGALARVDTDVGADAWVRGHAAVGAGDGGTGWRVDALTRSYTGPRGIDLTAQELAGKLGARLGAADVVVKLVMNRERSAPSYLGLTTPQFEDDPRGSYAIHDAFSLDRAASSVTWSAPLPGGLQATGAAYGHGISRGWTRQSYERADEGGDYERVVPGTVGGAPDDEGGTVYFLDETTTRDRLYTVGGVQQEVRWAHPVGDAAVEVLVGGRVHHEREHQEQFLGDTASTIRGQLTADEIWSGLGLSGWAAAQAAGRRWVIDLGVRGESWQGRRDILLGDEGAASGTTTSGGLLPGLGLGWRPAPEVLVFAGSHRGWAPPQTGDAVNADGTVLTLEAETSWNQELGARWVPRSWLRAELTGFALLFDNQVVAPTEASAESDPFVNGDPTRHLGAEASVTAGHAHGQGPRWSPRAGLDYTLLDARYSDGALKGNLLAYAPTHHLSGWAELDAPYGLSARVETAHVAGMYADAENTQSATLDGVNGWIPAHTTLDASIGWTLRHRALELRVWGAGKNLTDAVYIASRAPAGIQPAGFRSWLVGVDARWGGRREAGQAGERGRRGRRGRQVAAAQPTNGRTSLRR